MKLPNLMEKGAQAKQGWNNLLAKISVMFSVAVMSVTANADYDFGTLVDDGQSADDVAENADGVMKIVFNLIKALGVLVGFWLVYSGIMRVKKANEPNSQTTPMQGVLFILLGGCLGALPFIFLSSASIVQG